MECSLGKSPVHILIRYSCLNPYSNGMLTWLMVGVEILGIAAIVLILILMECSLGPALIEGVSENASLNPYSNGMLTWFY